MRITPTANHRPTTTRQLQALPAAHLPVLEKPISAAHWRGVLSACANRC